MVKIGNIELGEFPLLLAPMEDVSDPPFRGLCKKHGADLMFTEFISSEGLIRHADKSVQKLDMSQHPFFRNLARFISWLLELADKIRERWESLRDVKDWNEAEEEEHYVEPGKQDN